MPERKSFITSEEAASKNYRDMLERLCKVPPNCRDVLLSHEFANEVVRTSDNELKTRNTKMVQRETAVSMCA